MGGAPIWLVVAALGPMLAVTATAFVKAAVLLGILRGGLGVPGALPATVTTGLAVLLAALVMGPVAREAFVEVGPVPAEGRLIEGWAEAGARAWPVVERFLVRHTRAVDTALVKDVVEGLAPGTTPGPEAQVTAFMISELTAAFSLGVLLLMPFLLVDLLTAHTLQVVGYGQLPVPLVALPFKLLLFVAADGWGLFVRGFVESYSG